MRTTKRTKVNRQTIQMLEIELVILLAIVLVLGLLFGFSLAKTPDVTISPTQTELLRSGLGIDGGLE